jgi:hypothetical protein
MLKRFFSRAAVLAAGLSLYGALGFAATDPPRDTLPPIPQPAAPLSPPSASPWPHPLNPEPPGGPKIYGGQPEMNGYSLSRFPDFIHKWHFVTVRYRKDTTEMRLTYANDKAWEALQAGGTEYPDGAVFAKIGIMTQEDPGFTSSVVPSGAKRYQLMVMDHKKHAETDGWGYALFNTGGLTFEQDPKEQTAACHACHKLVPQRAYVFSQPMRLEIGVPAGVDVAKEDPLAKIKFTTKPVKELPVKVRTAIPLVFSNARVIDHEIAKHMIQGTLDEIRPTLGKEALRAQLPAVLMNDAGTRFSLVVANVKGPGCTLGNGKPGVEMLAVYTIKPGPTEDYPIQSLSCCEGP